ncbi:TRAP transporter large permease [Castellaniella hirudinis]|uniref:TRAP transporter large permease protein n=1 Tax=Castellaniella hirudinis TaxID=1144617 RepID=A0ABV8S3Y7_9BURK
MGSLITALALLLVGMPIGLAFALVVILGNAHWDLAAYTLGELPFDVIILSPLIAIPLFILVGELMNRSGLTRSIVELASFTLYKLKAKLGYVLILASGLMGAITGSSVATVAAMGGTLGAEMRKRNYPAPYAAALNAATGLLGVFIPPSIPLILYGSIVEVSIKKLFLASMLPGLLCMIGFACVHMWRSKGLLAAGVDAESTNRAMESSEQKSSTKDIKKWKIVRDLPALALPILVLGSIYGGIATPTEAAGIAALYALLIIFIRVKMPLKQSIQGLHGAVVVGAAILTIIAFTSILNRALVLEQWPQAISASTVALTDNPLIFLLLVNAVLLLIGMFMETNAATMLMGPLLAPAAHAYGIDPVHFGVLLVMNIEIGLITPPLAVNIYVAQKINSANLLPMLKELIPFFCVALAVLMAVTFFEPLTTWYHYLD